MAHFDFTPYFALFPAFGSGLDDCVVVVEAAALPSCVVVVVFVLPVRLTVELTCLSIGLLT